MARLKTVDAQQFSAAAPSSPCADRNPAGRMIRLQPDRRAKIDQRLRPVALLAPEFAARGEDTGERRIEPQHRVIVRYGAVDHILALKGAAACDQRLDAVRSFSLFVIDQRAAGTDDLVVIVAGGGRNQVWRGVNQQIPGRLGTGRERAVRERDPQDGRENSPRYIEATSHRLPGKKFSI